MDELPALVGVKYRPIRLIGRGGMGMVYEVVHENTGEHLALKLLLARARLAPDLVERFRREARATAAIKSDHVVRVTDADVAPELDAAPFLVMELLEGKNFEELCAERTPTPFESLDWLRQAARGLDKAHRQRIVHRDLKPANLFLAEREDRPPIVKILDFGIAKMLGEAGSETVSGQILGTPRYMAPEQAAQGGHEISVASDRYALGLIAFRLLSGRHYFDGGNVVQLLLDVARGATSAPSSLGCALGPGFDAWFMRACAHDPARRFESCVEQIEALAKAVGLAVTTAEPTRTLGASVVSGRPGPVATSRRTLLWVAGLIGLALFFVVIVLRAGPPRVTGASAPGTSPLSAAPEPAVPGPATPAPVQPPEAASNSSQPRVAPVAPAARPPPAAAPAPSTRVRPPPKRKPKDSIWSEP